MATDTAEERGFKWSSELRRSAPNPTNPDLSGLDSDIFDCLYSGGAIAGMTFAEVSYGIYLAGAEEEPRPYILRKHLLNLVELKIVERINRAGFPPRYRIPLEHRGHYAASTA
jgi:hypothetical protein